MAATCVPATERSLDGFRFVRAVEHFDLASGAPHPPGYPLYVAPAKLIHHLGVETPTTSLAVVGLMGLALLIKATFEAGEIIWDRATARASATILGISPLVMLMAVRPMSDMLGTGVAWTIVVASLRPNARPIMIAAGVGCLAGIRPSVLPFALPAMTLLAANRRAWGACLIGGIAGVLLWAIPLAWVTGPNLLWDRSIRHLVGHFSIWGGTMTTIADPMTRSWALFKAIWAQALGGPWAGRSPVTLPIATAILIATLQGIKRLTAPIETPPGLRTIAWSVTAYTVWIALAQNIVNQPRHVLPLVPVLALLIGKSAVAATTSSPRTGFTSTILIVGVLAGVAQTASLLHRQSTHPPPMVRVAHHVPEGAQLATSRGIDSWLKRHAPSSAKILQAENVETARAATKGRLLVTGNLGGTDLLPSESLRYTTAMDPWIDFSHGHLSLYRVEEAP